MGMREIARAIAKTVAPAAGITRIDQAISQFEKIAQEIEAGVETNDQQKAVNVDEIQNLEAQNRALDASSARGRSVAAKLRELIA